MEICKHWCIKGYQWSFYSIVVGSCFLKAEIKLWNLENFDKLMRDTCSANVFWLYSITSQKVVPPFFSMSIFFGLFSYLNSKLCWPLYMNDPKSDSHSMFYYSAVTSKDDISCLQAKNDSQIIVLHWNSMNSGIYVLC